MNYTGPSIYLAAEEDSKSIVVSPLASYEKITFFASERFTQRSCHLSGIDINEVIMEMRSA